MLFWIATIALGIVVGVLTLAVLFNNTGIGCGCITVLALIVAVSYIAC